MRVVDHRAPIRDVQALPENGAFSQGVTVMTCPTCSHVMALVSDSLHWCPRCGTLLTAHVPSSRPPTPGVPLLVERCRRFYADLAGPGQALAMICRHWRVLGIVEAIAPDEVSPDVHQPPP